MARYELTCEFQYWQGVRLRRVRRLTDGQLGGWLECETNLDQGSGAWVADDPKVWGDARVFGRARVSGTAVVRGSPIARVGGTAQVFGYARLRKI